MVQVFTEEYFEKDPVGTRYFGDIGFLLGFYRDVDRLRIEIEVTQLYDIVFQHHNDAIFKVVLISDKDENATLFHLSKYSDKVYGNIVCKMQIEMRNLYIT